MGKKPSPGQVKTPGEEVVELIPSVVGGEVVSLSSVELSVTVVACFCKKTKSKLLTNKN